MTHCVESIALLPLFRILGCPIAADVLPPARVLHRVGFMRLDLPLTKRLPCASLTSAVSGELDTRVPFSGFVARAPP